MSEYWALSSSCCIVSIEIIKEGSMPWVVDSKSFTVAAKELIIILSAPVKEQMT